MTFTAIDLSRVPAPQVVQTLSAEQILAEMLADLLARHPEFTALLESDPAIKLLEVAAYRELLLRQRINEAALAVMLPYALGTDLDNLGALFGVERLVTDPGDPAAVPPVLPSYEKDPEYRYRIQLSLEGLSTAGPEGAYIYHSLSASGQVLDASATSPSPDDIKGLVYSVLSSFAASAQLIAAMQTALDGANWPGDVLITILSRIGNGVASPELQATVNDALNAESVRPLTDYVQVQSATITQYAIAATLYFYAGPDREVVLANAQAAAEAYAEAQHRLGRDVTLSGLYAALHQPGVQRVELNSPAASIVVGRQGATYCTGITLLDGGLDE